MRRVKQIGYKAFCALLTAVTAYFLCGRELAEAAESNRRAALSAAKAAANLGIDAEQITNPDAWLAKQKARAEQKRQASLAQMRRFTHAEEQEARARAAKEEARRATQHEGEKLRRELAKATALHVSEDKLKSQLVKMSPSLNEAIRRNGVHPRPSTADVKLKDVREHLKPPHFAPPAPRAAGMHGRLSEPMKEFYASVLGQDASVLLPDGSIVSVEEQLLGIKLPEVRLASIASDLGLPLPLMGALPAPTVDDLAQTPETVQTSAITQLAAALNHQPLALYNYVHTKIATELYYGSKKGANATLLAGAGNDFDQAALLIALLRASNIPARYEYGSVRLTLAQASSLTGAADATTAAYLFAKSGIPAGVGADGQTVLVERAWVRAYVGYGEYRGVGPGGEKIWVRLDPALKRINHTQTVNLRGLVHFDFDAYLGSLTQNTPKEIYEAQLLAAARSKSLCNNLDAALDKATVIEDSFRLLPAEHPAKVESSLLTFARPPDNFRFKVTLTLDGEAKSFELPELQMHSLSLRYVGATNADQQAIQQAGGIANVVPYQVSVAPVLGLDGVEVQRFTPLNPGLAQTLTVQVTVPGGSPAFASHNLVSGSIYALSVSAGQVPTSRVDEVRRSAQGLTGDELVEAQGQLALVLYAQQLETNEPRLFALQGHASIEDVLEGIAGQELRVQVLAGTPVALAPSSYFIDVGRDSLTPIPKNQDASMVPELVKLSGHDGSALECKVWEEILSSPGVSAVKIIQAAASQQIPVFKLTQGSVQRQQLQGYSSVSLADVDNALSAGWLVTIPQRPVNYLTYANQEGYILLNPVNGSGGYRINTTLNGGGDNGNNPTGGPSNICTCCDGSCIAVGSTVNLANGTWRETFSDLALPAIGLPIAFTRVYASRNPVVTEMGAGWMHSYGMYLRPEVDGFTYINEELLEVKFTRVSDGYQRPPGFAMTLADLPDGHRLRTKNGMVYEFNASNQLRSIAEPSGNTSRVVYANGLISQVVDSSGTVALTFVHLGNKISGATDRAGRTLAFAYNADDLASATDVLGKIELYAYDSAHHLTQRTDRRGKVWINFYDLRGRWVGSRNPLGQENSVTYDLVNLRSVYTDKTNHAWTTVYNAAGNPTATIDPLGNREENTWDSDFNRLTHKDSRGFVTTFQYDANRNLLSQRDPDGRFTFYSYEPNFNQVTTINSTGLPFVSNTYDSSNGRLLSRTDGLGTTSYGFDARGKLQSVTAPGASTTAFTYDATGNVKTVTSPTGGITALDYDSAGHLVKVTDPNQNARTLEVDAKGQVSAMVDAKLARTEFSYDDNGNSLTVKDAAQNTTSFAYDDANRLVRTTDALGNTIRTEYDGEGRVAARTDARRARTVTKYDDAGRVIQTVTPDGATTNFAFCAAIGDACSGGSCTGASEPCCVIDALGNMRTKEFDSMGRVTKVTDPLGRATVQTYESGGRLDSISGPNQVPTQYGYGFNGLLASVSTTLLTANYQYDARGNRTQVNANGQVTNFAYDLANRLTTETNPLNIATRYSYDAAGNRKAKTDGNNQVTTYGYDANNRLTSVLFQDNSQYVYDYDSRGNRTLEQGPSHRRTLIYDELNRVKQVNDATFDKTLTYAYDANGNRTSLAEGALNFGYAYDSLNRLRKATDSLGNSVVFDYDADGRRTSVTRPNGVTTTHAYDAASQVTSISHAKAAAVLLAFSYGYDAQGNRISRTREDGTQEVYAYDSDLRLAGVAYGTSRTVQYRLDALGNRVFMSDTNPPSSADATSTGYNYNSFNQLTTKSQSAAPFAVTNFAYDNNGNLLSETTAAQVKSYTWDLDNRLRQVTLPGGATNLFDYDSNGLRIRKNDSTGTTGFLLNGPSVLEELNPSGSTVTSYLTNPQVIDEIDSFQQAGTTYYPLTDALGSIYAIADSTGSVVRNNSYDVYGERLTSAGTGPQIVFGYAGREHSPDLGLNYNRHRYLDPRNGKWTQPDRLRMRAGPNFFLYANAAPPVFRDTYGRFSTRTHDVILDRALGTTVSPQDLSTLKRASADLDNLLTGQSAVLAYQHAMRAPWQTVVQADSAYQGFVASTLAAAVALETGSINCGADAHEASIYKLGTGMHAIMDSHSPYHAGFQVWYGILLPLVFPAPIAIGVWQSEIAHHNAENAILDNDPSVIDAAQDVSDFYYQYRNLLHLTRLMPGLTGDSLKGLAADTFGSRQSCSTGSSYDVCQ